MVVVQAQPFAIKKEHLALFVGHAQKIAIFLLMHGSHVSNFEEQLLDHTPTVVADDVPYRVEFLLTSPLDTRILLDPVEEEYVMFQSRIMAVTHLHSCVSGGDDAVAYHQPSTVRRPEHLRRSPLSASIEEAIGVCGKQLFYIYAWQRAPGTGQLPGIGPTDCTPWIAALAKADYQWYVNPFMHHQPEPDAMAKVLARLTQI